MKGIRLRHVAFLLAILSLASFFPPSFAADSTSAARPTGPASANQDWRGQIPASSSNPALWSALLDELAERQLGFGLVAAAERMLLYFPDLATQETAYRGILKAVRAGYPFLVHEMFREGNLQPESQDSFSDAYFTYKGIIEEKKGVSRWSQAFFKHIDTTKAPEFIFYQGIKAYQAKDLDKAIEIFSKLVDLDVETLGRPQKVRIARTLARLYFETEKYEKSFEIYRDFLLKLNPMTPTDWLEAAWDLFYLKRYPQALSYLYNLEAPSSNSALLFEKYILRGLIYKQICAEKQLDALARQFQQVFGATIHGLKLGQPLTAYPFLKRIRTSNSAEFRQVDAVLSGLKSELEQVRRLRNSGLGEVLYSTEIRRLEKMQKFLENEQLAKATELLILTAENILFLRFEMQRAKVDPNKVFANEKKTVPDVLRFSETKSDSELTVAWKQNGDFWRSERQNYNALIEDQCRQ